MKNRIYQIMKREGLNQKEFSEKTGISPATLSSIFNGRTSPTLNHAELLHKCFPLLNMSWLMFGEGPMFEPKDEEEAARDGATARAEGDLFGGTMGDDAHGMSGVDDASSFAYPSSGGDGKVPYIREVVKFIDKPQRKITEIRIFFDDGTYETFPGR